MTLSESFLSGYIEKPDAGPDYWASRLSIDESSFWNAKAKCDNDSACHAIVYAPRAASLKSGFYTAGRFHGMSGSPGAVACASGDPHFLGWKYYYKGLGYIFPTPRASGFRHRDVTASGSCSISDVGMLGHRLAAYWCLGSCIR